MTTVRVGEAEGSKLLIIVGRECRWDSTLWALLFS